MLYDINNRGRKLWGTQPFFLRHGYVSVWSGWIAQVPPEPPLLRLEAPIALDEDYVPDYRDRPRGDDRRRRPRSGWPVSDRRQLAFEPVVSRAPAGQP